MDNGILATAVVGPTPSDPVRAASATLYEYVLLYRTVGRGPPPAGGAAAPPGATPRT